MVIKRNFIPTIISLSSILSGFIAIVMASYDEIRFAAAMILLGALFDAIDGKVARALHATNDMGKEIDSLADLATFGLAPGYLLYQGSLYKFGNWGILVSAFIPIFAALRLARFNLKPTKHYFEGIPSTWAGISIALLQGFFYKSFSPYFYLIYAIVISFLMISSFHYLKPSIALFRLSAKKVIFYVLFLMILLINYQMLILLFILWYNLSGIFASLFKYKPKKLKSYKIYY